MIPATVGLGTELRLGMGLLAAVRATHRDLIEFSYRPAATPEDLLDDLNDLRPHVVDFSGHAGSAAVLFDNASIDTPDGCEVAFDLLARVIGATVDLAGLNEGWKPSIQTSGQKTPARLGQWRR